MERNHHHHSHHHHHPSVPVPVITSTISSSTTDVLSTDQATPSGHSSCFQTTNSTITTPSKDSTKEQLQQLRVKLERAEAIQRGAENLLHQVGAGQGLITTNTTIGSNSKRKDFDPISSNSNVGIGNGPSQLQVSVEAELDLANKNVKGLVKEIEALEALTAGSPRKGRRRLQNTNHSSGTGGGVNGPTSAMKAVPTQDSVIFVPSEDDKVKAKTDLEVLLTELKSSTSPEFITLRKLSTILKTYWSYLNLRLQDVMDIALDALADNHPTELRAEAYRLLRHSVLTRIDIDHLRQTNMELFIIKSLSRDSRHETEKHQALVFVRSMMDKGCESFMTTGLVRAIVAIAENLEERLRQLSIETLAELMVRDFGLLAESDGVKVLMGSLADGGTGLGDLAPYLAAAVMAMVDRPMFRQYLRPGVDFEIALAGITEASGAASQAQDERVRSSARLIVFLMKSWTGLMFLCLNKKHTLRMYIQSLKVPSDSVRLILLDALFDIFQIKTSTWYTTFMAGKRLTYYQKPSQQFTPSHTQLPAKETLEKVSDRTTLVDHFLAIILLVFFDVNLLETLIEITESKPPTDNPQQPNLRSFQSAVDKSSEVRKKASLLIAEILDLSNRLLPLHYGTRIQSLPRLFELAASFRLGEERSTGAAALREVDSLHRTKQRLASPFLAGRNRSGSNSTFVDEISLFRAFGLTPVTLSSTAGVGGGSGTAASLNDNVSVKSSLTANIGASASVSGLSSGLSLITGVNSSTTSGATSGTSGGVSGSGSGTVGSTEPAPAPRLLHWTDPRHRINLINIDDFSFRALVIETQVLVTKDHTRWNVEKLLELIEGTLYMNPKRLEELTRSTKVMKRVLGFLHPFEGRYPYIKRTKHTSKYTKLACSTLQTLLSDSVGVKFLSEDKLVEQIGLGLRQLDPHAGITQTEMLFSNDRVEDTLVHGYFQMLGTLSRYPEGIKLMEKFKIFTSFYALCEMRSRDDLVKEVIENVDYSINGHCRLVISKALTSSVKHVRLFATHHLEKLISRRNLSSPSGMSWLIRLLLTQLHDPSPEVCGLAVEILEEACAGSTEILETVVNMRPSLENLGDVGAPLLLRFLSTSVGARYLNEINWTEREMDEWYRERNRDYVIQLEMYLSKVLNADGTRDEEDEELIASANGTPPPHFYGELVKTSEGRDLLKSKGHFRAFIDTIRQHGLEEKDLELIAKLKTALWAIGNIGSSVGGLAFLEADSVVDDIAGIAETSNVFSVRGTCYYVLGLISSTPEGTELLSDSGWNSVQTPLGTLTGICVPERLDEFVVHPTWRPKRKPAPDLIHYGPFQSPLQRQILVAIANLSNHLLANNSSRTLARMKLKHREDFQDPALFHRALRILANYHYRLMTRRYVMELFGDIGLDSNRLRAISTAGEAMRMPRSKTNHTITQDYQAGYSRRSNSDDNDNDGFGEEDEDIEVSLNQLPLRSGTGLLEAYDKTDYYSDESEEGGEVMGGKKLTGGVVGGRAKEVVTRLEPLITIRGFLLS
ncbi:hypothetical protein CROQUDRAFT_111390 [Cronartium quercuum f. sp. fusiforme G11]|uniref:Uncharacterized protein n=1 Tax=Cronartium quercuum f. sp. fusiforme G11 TaxID=708437 RepID=A0A9P6N9I5_9BASI|nr:hypothetical protein CROQUDRAFT_111390 [Cronartium quercuum f. sp. fusiforme G11]